MLGRKKEAARTSLPDAPLCPYSLLYLWQYYLEISCGLSSSGFGYAVISWDALLAWCHLMRVEFEPWEVQTLVTLSRMHAVILSEKKEQQAPSRPSSKPKGKRK